MRLILLHGYLLRGTGSNIYVANVAQAWRRQGHAVTVICQEREAAALPFVDEVFLPGDASPSAPVEEGRLRVVVPDIGGLLPVYVFDRYEGYEVRTIPEMSTAQRERHIELTGAALRDTVRLGADRVLVNHVLLGPVIARRALRDSGVPYDVKVHGSAVEYTLVPHPGLMDYAVEGLAGAERIHVGTRYVRDRVRAVFLSRREEIGLEQKLQVTPPGMDPELFRPSDDRAAGEERFLATLKSKIEQSGGGRRAREVPVPAGLSAGELHTWLVAEGETYDQRTPDADLIERWPKLGPDEPVIGYLGKFLGAKGVGELLTIFPRVLQRVPQSRLLLIGFGSYREHLEAMVQALRAGDAETFARVARAGDFVEDLDFGRWFRPLSEEEAARITITGLLDHDCLRDLLPLLSVSVVPSKWPEAFGMVAVEAMAAGVLPLCNDHAGLRDVLDTVAAGSPDLAERMQVPRQGFVEALPDRIVAALELLSDSAHRTEVGRRLREIAVANFSWDGIARRLLAEASPRPAAARPRRG